MLYFCRGEKFFKKGIDPALEDIAVLSNIVEDDINKSIVYLESVLYNFYVGGVDAGKFKIENISAFLTDVKKKVKGQCKVKNTDIWSCSNRLGNAKKFIIFPEILQDHGNIEKRKGYFGRRSQRTEANQVT